MTTEDDLQCVRDLMGEMYDEMKEDGSTASDVAYVLLWLSRLRLKLDARREARLESHPHNR